ncbi:hypothetical protein L1987_74029 [Smallanthus sonchifolius]|uniref:Uncharacterized protein n=1 Tax=Smallanthus sonchifolius TaxID=185202 RepID=A0ACB9A1K3_9ASTR|nr:hypothetical protein L1987_74029 [Smallanthus sonchifolius]
MAAAADHRTVRYKPVFFFSMGAGHHPQAAPPPATMAETIVLGGGIEIYYLLPGFSENLNMFAGETGDFSGDPSSVSIFHPYLGTLTQTHHYLGSLGRNRRRFFTLQESRSRRNPSWGLTERRHEPSRPGLTPSNTTPDLFQLSRDPPPSTIVSAMVAGVDRRTKGNEKKSSHEICGLIEGKSHRMQRAAVHKDLYVTVHRNGYCLI